MGKKIYSAIFEIDATGNIKELLGVVDKDASKQMVHGYHADGLKVITRDYLIYNEGPFKRYDRAQNP